MAHSHTITVLLYREGGDWVAHALEFDIIGVGATLDEAYSVLKGLLVFHIQYAHENGFEDTLYHRAPDKYYRLLEDAKRLGEYNRELESCQYQVEAYASAVAAM